MATIARAARKKQFGQLRRVRPGEALPKHQTACIQRKRKFDQTYANNNPHGWVADGSRPAVKGPISRSGLPTIQMSENSVTREKVTNAPKEYLSSGRGVADSNSSIREALTAILRETAANAYRTLSGIPARKDPDKPRTKAWRCSCGPHLIPPTTFRALRDVRRRKVLSHFATAFLLESFVYLEKKAVREPARNFFAEGHTSRAWLTAALGINDATVERKSRSAWFVSGGKPPNQLVLDHERSSAQEPLAAALNAALEGKLRDLASKEPVRPETGSSNDLEEAPPARVPATPQPTAQPSAGAEENGSSGQPVQKKQIREEPLFEASDPEYNSIIYRGKRYDLTTNQAIIVKLLHGAYLRGFPVVKLAVIQEKIGWATSRPKDSFKGHPLWGTLIISVRKPRGCYRLNLPDLEKTEIST